MLRHCLFSTFLSVKLLERNLLFLLQLISTYLFLEDLQVDFRLTLHQGLRSKLAAILLLLNSVGVFSPFRTNLPQHGSLAFWTALSPSLLLTFLSSLLGLLLPFFSFNLLNIGVLLSRVLAMFLLYCAVFYLTVTNSNESHDYILSQDYLLSLRDLHQIAHWPSTISINTIS